MLLIVNNRKEILETKELIYLNFNDEVKEVIEWLKTNEHIYPITAIGFRLLIGDPGRYKPEIITEDLLNNLNQFIYLVPNHLTNELSTIQSFMICPK